LLLPKLGYRIDLDFLYQFDFQFNNVWFHFLNKNLMKVNEDLSILFWTWRQKASKDGRAPIYVRITVKGAVMASHQEKKFILTFGTKKTVLLIRLARISSLLIAISPRRKPIWKML
jgi:hypothetical protein